MKKILVVLLMGILAVGCSNNNDEPKETPSSSPSGDGSQLYGPPLYDAYLFTVREEIPHLLILRDGAIIRTGKNVCTTLEDYSPLTQAELYDAITGFSRGSGFMNPEESAYFIGVSAGAFCPDIADEIEDLTGTTT